ncbi:MAG: helix-turn-helix transcriptional regulator [Aquificaceae bacterium]|nr:helix-turn-helix transcriptional regulator [Aquificaceae bacterium]MCS7196518.1 helix-turn-helix transcriptional regulator [Aquificaceae bacterium]MCX7989519.1 helix-turn-helix transcriptional regulator [Aquificaceae bacterium]MDW8294491.1 helix-turn-helix domain-containing protein [Aquificaceae bacterium]
MKLKNSSPTCPAELAIQILSGKWKLYILKNLMEGKKRFSQLQKSIPGITQRMLSKQLKELEACGLIRRTVYPVVPPMVEYELTEIGKRLEGIFETMHRWGIEYMEGLEEASTACIEEEGFEGRA